MIDFTDGKSAQNKSSGWLVFKNVEFMNCDIGLDNDLENPQTISGVNFIWCILGLVFSVLAFGETFCLKILALTTTAYWTPCSFAASKSRA